MGGLAPSASLGAQTWTQELRDLLLDIKLALIKASQDTNHLAYMLKYDTILGKYTGPLRLIANLQRYSLKIPRNMAALHLDFTCKE